MSPHSASSSTRAIFDRQIACIRSDDRETQLRLYAEDCIYEFPFATDRPRRIVGREEIRRIMTPLWDEARRKGVRIAGYDGTLHETTDAEVAIAEFTLSVEVGQALSRLSFVQFIRVRGGCIVELREYFSPQARSEALERRSS
jgi:ketosteroid isomerase-like protein